MSSLLGIAAINAAGALLLALLARLAERPLHRRPGLIRGLWLLVLLRLLMPPLLEVELPLLWAPSSPEVSPRVGAMTGAAWLREGSAPAVWFSATGAVVLVWLLGSLLILALAAARIRRFQRGLWNAKPASETLRGEVARLCARMGIGRPPEVVVVPGPVSPLVWGTPPRVRLIVPGSLIGCLSPEELRALLAHELAHVAHGDPWVRHLELAARCLFWWHPVVWWAGRRLRRAEERCCDARVVSTLPRLRRAYSGCLLKTMRFLARSRSAALVPACGLRRTNDLEGRLTMIMTRGWAEQHPWPIRLGAVAFGLALLATFPSLANGGAAPAGPQVEAQGSEAGSSEGPGQQASPVRGKTGEEARPPLVERSYMGEPIDISIRDADVREVMAIFSEMVETRFALDPTVKGTVTVELSNVPWDQALDQILRLNRLEITQEGRVWYVHPVEEEEAPGTEQR